MKIHQLTEKFIYNMLKFGEALEALKLGFKAKRKGWEDQYIVLIEFGNQTKADRKAGVVKVENEFKVVYSYIALNTDDLFMPWSPSHVDLLEEDWIFF